jgi:hypothetical protein
MEMRFHNGGEMHSEPTQQIGTSTGCDILRKQAEKHVNAVVTNLSKCSSN